MQRLFLFFLRFNGFFLFLLLEGIALFTYFSRNTTQEKSAFLSSANGAIGQLYEYSNRVKRYWNLAAVNDSLAKENARLKMRLPSSQFSHLIDTVKVDEDLYEQQYVYTAARVIRNSISHPQNHLTINRGYNHRVTVGSGVVSSTGNGIVGVVRKVSPNFAVAMSVLNRDIRVSAKIKRNNYFGIITWDGLRTEHVTLEAVPKHAVVEIGDTIITSGFSTIFPEGITIGRVDSFYIESGSNFYTIDVRLEADINNIQHVYIIDDLMKKERLKLEEEAIHE